MKKLQKLRTVFLEQDMVKKHLTLLILVLALLAFPFTDVSAESKGKPVTPYGDFCKRCGNYGTCKKPMKPHDSEKAMKEYYSKKGFNVEMERSKGRFLKAKVKDKGKTVDVIIFDRRTGRIRSIY
ncbi:MAG: hypothetical protein JSV71_02960 [Nitrospiraceae bacterium]|nr:MAG: hypothetical protein JSV71_02960 [Nitrospiraceae bacterium]